MLRQILLRLLIGARPPTRAPSPSIRRPGAGALIDGRDCDQAAADRLAEKLEEIFGPLPAARLMNVKGSAEGSAWLAVMLRSPRGHTIYMRKDAEAKIVRTTLPWWEATGLEPEYEH